MAGAEGASARYRGTPLVNVWAFDPSIQIALEYATPDNFTGATLPGYCEVKPLLLRRPAKALARVEARLRRSGYGVRILDAYRPARASAAMVRWARRTGHEELLNGYIAARSRHNLGAAVDLTLVHGDRAVDMGTKFDTFSTRAHTRNAKGAALRNRMRLVRAMSAEGFANYYREWWHFDYPAPGARRLDVTIGC